VGGSAGLAGFQVMGETGTIRKRRRPRVVPRRFRGRDTNTAELNSKRPKSKKPLALARKAVFPEREGSQREE
jgi:hypothetical protein